MNSKPLGDSRVDITSNAVYNWIGWIWPLLLGLLATPFIVSHLGVAAYGIFALLSVVTGYLSVMDLGLSEAAVKFIAEYHVKGDIPTLQSICRCSMFLFSIFGAIGALIVVITTPLLVPNVFHVSAELVKPAKTAFYLMAISFLINMWVGVLANVPEALQRYDLLNRVRLILGTLSTLATVAVLALHYSLQAVVLVQLASTLAGLVIQYSIARHLLPYVTWWPRFDKKVFQRLFNFGGSILVNRITSLFNFQIPQGVIAAISGTAQVTYYAIPLRLAVPLMSMFTTTLRAFFPMSAAMIGAERQAGLKNIYLKATRLLVLMATAIVLPMIFLSHPIMRYWMGVEFASHSYFILAYLAGAFWLMAFTILPNSILMGAGMPKYIAWMSLIGVFINVTLYFILTPKFGAAGLAAGFLIGTALIAPVSSHLAHSRVLKVGDLCVITQAYARPILAALTTGGVAYLGIVPHITSLLTLLLGFLALEVLYLVLCWAVGAIRFQDLRSWAEWLCGIATNAFNKFLHRRQNDENVKASK